MQQFVFVGTQGTFPVPSGESRLGSDAACQICIRGEGVLPVHAYLQSDGEKLLIRPADGGASTSGYSGAAVSIDGKLLSGSVTLAGGQEIEIGGVQMRLHANGPRLWTRLWRQRWLRGITYFTLVLLTLAAFAFSYLYFFVFDPKRLEDKIKTALSTNLLRDEIEISMVEIKPFDGIILIKDLKLKDHHSFASGSADFIRIPSAAVTFHLWPLLRSWFHECDDIQVVINNPELNIERAQSDGAFNIQDIVNKATQKYGLIDLGVNKLNLTLEVKDGTVRLKDNYTKIGETSLEKINLVLSQTRAGEPLVIQRCEMKVTQSPRQNSEEGTPSPAPSSGNTTPAKAGTLKLAGRINVVNDACMIDTARISAEELELDLNQVDLARVFEHFGYAWEPYKSNFKVVLGKPITSKVKVNIQDLKHLRFNGWAESESLLSIKESGRPPLGNIPMRLDGEMLLADNGSGYRPNEINLKLRSGSDLNNPGTTYLAFDAIGKLNPGGISNYRVRLECTLQDLCNTDVGRRLGLEGRLGGKLEGQATLFMEADGYLKIDAHMEGKDSYVMVSDAADANKPTAAASVTERRYSVRQPLPLNFNCYARAKPEPSGGLQEIDIESFTLSAPSFVANSKLKEGFIKGLAPDGILEAQASFSLNLKGKEFWTEFAPILALFGFTKPIEEALDLQISMYGKNNTIAIGAQGKAARQWGADPAPVRLQSYIEYNAKAANLRHAGKAAPYLSLTLEVASEQGKPSPANPNAIIPVMYVRTEALCSQNDKERTVTLVAYDKNDKDMKTPLPGLKIESDLVTLRERFKPYIEGYLQGSSSDGSQAGVAGVDGWLKFYRATSLSGELKESGLVTIKRMLDSKNAEPDKIEFNLDLSGTDLEIHMPIRDQPGGLASLPLIDRPDLAGPAGPARLWSWKESAVTLGLKGSYEQRMSGNKEEADKERLDIERLAVKGSLGAFLLSAKNLDVFKLYNLRALPNQTWTDCLGNFSMSGQLNPPAYDFARSLHIIPEDHPISGTLALEVVFDREKDALDMRKFTFKQDEATREFFLSHLDVSGSLVRVRELVARLFPPVADGVPFSAKLASFVDQAGPAAFLDHLGDELTIKSLQVETGALVNWLCKDYQGTTRQPPAILAAMIHKDWRPEGTWSAANVKFSRVDDPDTRKYQLVGALRNDFSCFGAPILPGGPRSETISFSQKWAFGMGLAVSTAENTIAVKGDANFDQAVITAALPRLNYDYKKNAGEACKLEFEGLYAHGVLAHLSKLKLTGKPISLEMRDFEAVLTPPEKRSVDISELQINDGPTPCTIVLHKYEPGSDNLNVRVSMAKTDLSYLTSLPDLKMRESIKLTGVLKDVNAGYKGSILALQAMLENPSQNALRLPKLEPGDTRLNGLNPESDALDFNAQLDGVRAEISSGKGRSVALTLGGGVHLTSRDLAWKEFSAGIDYITPEIGTVKHTLTIPNLLINSTDAKLNLMRALRAPGMPLNVGAPLTFTTPVNVPALLSAYDTILTGLGAAPAANAQGELRFSALEQLVASGSLKAPGIITGTGNELLPFFGSPNFTFKGLKLSVPLLSTDLYAGKIMFTDADCDLAKASVVQNGAKLLLKGVGFHTKVKLTDADLGALVGSAANNKNGYGILGRLDALGQMDGMDFSGVDRLSWNGALKFKLSNLMLEMPLPQEGKIEADVAPWSANFISLGPRLYPAFMQAASNESVNSVELAHGFQADEARPVNGLLLGLQAYLARTVGVELTHFEFDPLTPTVFIRSGIASLDEPLKFVGRGSNEGLDLQIEHLKINLADETLSDTQFYPVAVPPLTLGKLHLDKWGDVKDEYVKALAEGKMPPVHLAGPLGSPGMKFPWPQLKTAGRRALFGAERINDLEALNKARATLLRNWGATAPDLEAAAAWADRSAAGLPGTVTSRYEGETIISRVAGLPKILFDRLSNTGPTISPVQSLHELLFTPPDPLVQPLGPPVPQAK